MTIDDLTRTTGEWLKNVGPMSDVVISSRVRLARNLADFPFLSASTETERTEVYRCLVDAITSLPEAEDALLVDINEADPMDRQILVERHLISRQHAMGEGSRGVTISAEETSALMVNEEDHLRVQGLRSGLQLKESWRQVSDIDDRLAASLAFAFDREFGYLTACPTNVGTGIRVSVMLHLPALRMAREIERVARAARDMRLAVRGLYGEGTDAVGDLYQVSNQTTLGQSEEQIIEGFGSSIIPKIVEYERAARESLVAQQPYRLDDRIWRAYGTLCNARRISSEETQTLLSPVRLGIHTGRFDKLDVAKLNELFLYTQPAHLQRIHGGPLEGEERGIVRADYLRERIAANGSSYRHTHSARTRRSV